MICVTVQASKKYDVLIGSDLLKNAGVQIRKIHRASKVAIISDSNVWPIYGKVLTESLKSSGMASVSFVFPAGEASKTLDTYIQILNFLAENQITRADLVIALGGGVVGDITGFVSATYLRGLAYVQIPTSLLAMVDSSVGGKTAVDLPAGKNLVGAFKQPALVICDTETLSTLPKRQLMDGCAEVIKYSILYDAELFNELSSTGPEFNRERVIAKCIQYKRDVVQMDEYDTGERQKLNLGHTFGHGIEASSNFEISHGCAVAAGMAVVTKASVAYGYSAIDVYEKLVKLLEKFSLPTGTDYPAEQLLRSALSDKKRLGDFVNLIVPYGLGDCRILPTPITELESFIKAGL